MKHHFMNYDNVVDRLVEEWRKYGRIIVAYDYDNTVYDYHGQGHDYSEVINLLRDCAQRGAYLIVFTACSEEKYPDIRADLDRRQIPYHAINEQPPFLGFTGRKIYYNILLDDRAGLAEAYSALSAALARI